MGSHRAWAYEESLAYQTISQAAGNKAENLALTIREVGDLGLSSRVRFSGVRIVVRSEHDGCSAELDSVTIPKGMLFNQSIVYLGAIAAA